MHKTALQTLTELLKNKYGSCSHRKPIRDNGVYLTSKSTDIQWLCAVAQVGLIYHSEKAKIRPQLFPTKPTCLEIDTDREYLSRKELKEKGWKPKMIDEHLGKADKTAAQEDGNIIKYYLKSRVNEIGLNE